MAATSMSLLPAITPPPGLTSDFKHPPSTGHIVYIVMGVCLSLVTLMVAIRIYTRAHIAKPLWWDDRKRAIIPCRSATNMFSGKPTSLGAFGPV
jgi:hypothetical protein